MLSVQYSTVTDQRKEEDSLVGRGLILSAELAWKLQLDRSERMMTRNC